MRLLVVSNRLPVACKYSPEGTSVSCAPTVGGLATAMLPILQHESGVWVGWAGVESQAQDQAQEHVRLSDALRECAPCTLKPVLLNRAEISLYYDGAANQAIWPLFHSMPHRAQSMTADEWKTYCCVNRRFAQSLLDECSLPLEATRPAASAGEPVFWIHDFHLLLVPAMLNGLLSSPHCIGFFLHIPFPPVDMLTRLGEPVAVELLVGMLGANLIGFHCNTYAENFMAACSRLLPLARVSAASMRIEYAGRTVRVGVFPIGVPFDEFEALARSGLEHDDPCENVRSALETSGEMQLMLHVSRLDYSKSIPATLLAYKRLLECHESEMRGKITFLVIAVPSRENVQDYKEETRRVLELAEQVNAEHATPHWQPLVLWHHAVPQSSLARLYAAAAVMVVLPEADGMNLTAKEFVACQISADAHDAGVLLLSSGAGASHTMGRDAVLVGDVNDATESSAAMWHALCMPNHERATRMRALRAQERKHSIHWWSKRFLQNLQQAPSDLEA